MSFSLRYVLFLAAACLLALAVPAAAQDRDTEDAPGTGPNYEARLQGVQDQMRSMDGRIEQLEFSIKRLEQTMQRFETDTDARLTKLESAPPPPVVVSGTPPNTAPAPLTAAAPQPPATATAAVPAAETAPIAPVNGTLGAIKMQDGRITGAVKNPQAPPLPATPPDYGLSPQEQYDRAFDLLRKTEYADAGAAFKDFIDKNPQDKLLDNAKYWYGETFYVQGRFDQAAVTFADAYQQNPKGNKAPDSLLKLAMSLGKLNKVPDACTTLDSLKGKYPNAPAKIRQQADQERARLKCGAAAQ